MTMLILCFQTVSLLCFNDYLQVENGLRGNSLLVIIADEIICRELRELELDFEDTGNENSIVHFLNELGWLFQRTKSPQLYSFRSKQSYQGFLKHKVQVPPDFLHGTRLVMELLDIYIEHGSLGITDDDFVPFSDIIS